MDCFEPETRFCPQVDKPVDIRMTEQQCRAEHGCKQRVCPLDGVLSAGQYDFLSMASASLDG